jgi:glycosyltransferase involved in cell wall biosynthesis
MVEHFNVSQADEWAEKGLIPQGGRMFRSIRSFETTVLSRLDGIVYVSDFAKELLEERVPALASLPAATIPNFVTVSEAHVESMHERDLITVGTLEPRKNQGYLLQILAAAAAVGHRYTLTVVGDGPDRQRLERLAASLGVAGDVRFVGYHADPRTLMRRHRVYCHAARMENLPLALLEAMAEGLPVIAAGVGGIPTLMRPGREGEFWPLDDPSAAGRILTRLMGDDRRLAGMSSRSRARVEEAFTADAVIPRLETFLLRLAR